MPLYPDPLEMRFTRGLERMNRKVRALQSRTAGIDSGWPLMAVPGVIDPAYTSGNPKVLVNGSAALTGPYQPLASYTPAANDNVLLIPVVSKQTYVVAGATALTLSGVLAGPTAVNVKSAAFAGGAKGDGATDDAAAVQAALTAGAGAMVVFPAGIYVTSKPLTAAAGTTLQGAGNGATIIRLKAGTSVPQIIGMTANQLNYSAVIRDLQIDGNQANGGVAGHGLYLFAPSDCIVDSVRVVNVSGHAITLDGSGTFLATATKVLNSFVRSCGGDGLHSTQFATDTIISGCDFGACGAHAYYLNGIQAALVGSIGWGSTVGITVDGSSGEVWISGCRFDQNQYYGAWILAHNVTMTGSLIYDNSAAGTNSQPGIVVDSGSADVVIAGCRSVGGLNGGPQQSYGLTVNGTGAQRGALLVTGCDFTGNGIGAVSYAGMSTAGDRFDNVLGYNPQPAQAPTMAASGVAFPNPFPYACTVGFSGGSVSGVQVGGFNVPITYSLGQVRVPAGQTITATYSIAPTWTWFGD